MTRTKRNRAKTAKAWWAVAFILGLAVILAALTRLLTPKFLLSDTWDTTATYVNFYQVERDTVDVIFLGSSRTAAAFCPQELYDGYGISSYNLGCEQQNLLVSYYWLREALRYQTPQAVVLDVKELFLYDETESLNTSEACTRKAMDYMRWSSNKAEAVSAICRADSEQSELSYYFPLLRYHSRWKSLGENDFSGEEMAAYSQLRGFAPLLDVNEGGYGAFSPDPGAVSEAAIPLMREYLDRIADLCGERGIRLILVSVPYESASAGRYKTVSAYAAARGIPYFDFSTEELSGQIGYDFLADSNDVGHANLSGALKLTDFVGAVLRDDYGVVSARDARWEGSEEAFRSVCGLFELRRTTDIYRYLELLADERYSVFISARDDASYSLDEEIVSRMQALGLACSVFGQFRAAYLAVTAPEGIREEVGFHLLELTGTLRDGLLRYDMVSAGLRGGNVSSIVIDGEEYSMDGRGLNIVVYDNIYRKVMDSVCFDTFSPELTAVRDD